MTMIRYTEKGARYYIHPDTGEKHVSATTIASVIAKGYTFDRWQEECRLKDMRALADALLDASARGIDEMRRRAEHAIAQPGTAETIRKSTAHLGTRVHQWIDAAIRTGQYRTCDARRVVEKYRPYCQAFRGIVDRTDLAILRGDTVLYGHIAGHPVAGAIDGYGVVGGRRGIIDIKTANHLHKAYIVQLGIYRLLWEASGGDKVDGLFIVHVPRSDPQKAGIFEIPYEPEIVEMAVRLWFWRARGVGAKEVKT